MATAAKKPRQRGSLVDAVTLTEYPFQFEPSEHEDHDTTAFGEHHVVGHRLSGYHWVGGGKADVSMTIHLVCGANTDLGAPKPGDVGNYRMAQLASYQKQILVDTGGTNADGTKKMQYIKNPQPVPKLDSVAEAQASLKAKKMLENKKVLLQVKAFKALMDPQEDIGAPHPLLINMGGLYTGIQFLLVDLKTTYISRNYKTLEPYEVELKLKLHALGTNAKYSGSGATK